MRGSSAHNIIQKILDLLFPPTDQVKHVRDLSPGDLKRLKDERQPKKDFIRAVCDYRDDNVRAIVHTAKFAGSQAAARLMGALLQEELLGICQEERIFANRIVITPVPLSARRRQERGFNQSERICREIEAADDSNTFHKKILLKKTRETADQTQLSKPERRKNVRDAFRAQVDAVDEEVIIIIDDVTTTGSTLTEARRALKKTTDAKVIGAAFAH